MSIEAAPLLMNVHEAFAATEYGQKLAGQVRYERFKPTDVSNEVWVKLLGADVNNLTHMPLTLGLTQVMVNGLRRYQTGYLDAEEENVLGTAAIMHDWGEAIVGDISFSDKTDDHEAEEERELTGILSNLQGEAIDEAHHLISKATGEVIFSRDSKLGVVFNAVERVGYMRTAMRAARHVQGETAGHSDNGLRWIVADVIANQTRKLLEYAEVFVPVAAYMVNQSEAIEDAFPLVSPATFMNYTDDQQRITKAMEFAEAREAFHSKFS